MTDETEVVDSEHVHTNEEMQSSSQRSAAYRTTYVTPEIRTVKFRNTANFRDETIGRSMRVRFGIAVEEDIDWEDWEEYTSPKQLPPILMEKIVTVLQGGPYEFGVSTLYELQELEGVTWNPEHEGGEGPYTATVEESDP